MRSHPLLFLRFGPPSSEEPEIQIQMKPLFLSSENSATRQNEIDYIEGANFTQKSFLSSRKQNKPFAPDSATAQSINSSIPADGQYASLLAERAHDAAIFGPQSIPPPSTVFGSDPSEAKERIVSSVGSVKQLIHPRFTKLDETAWSSWIVRLREMKEIRAQQLSRDFQKKKPLNAVG
ncbi:hypothetical protein FBUS_09040 [Fasciolopsis buskii]|uniref:Uncharacterized protein n=1 Tax=Fasciolopsis buskii TaxID=27845 RepID=A0A8E0VKI1_9TREM|nr:hypothetical protein FBUS_09040 [Fasciolopsis buski]